VTRSKLLAADLAVSALMPILALWIYEVSNLVVLVIQGAGVSLSMVGWIPIGVSGVTHGGLSPLTKVLQVIMAAGLLLPLGAFFSRERLLVAETFAVSTIGVYLASSYWEALSLLTVVPLAVHALVFIAGTSALAIVLLTRSERLHHLRQQPDLTSLGPSH
jgi:hypothetical protein